MTQGFATGIKAGGDPRALPDYRTLCTEMARLGHPACPDVDWHSIEQCCLALFASNGADLQTTAAYALARSHLAGLSGMYEGLEVLVSLLRADAQPWPRGVSARAEILSGLFGSWQALLRELEINVCDLASLVVFSVQLEHVRLTLLEQTQVPIISLEGLRAQVVQRASRIERDAQAAVLVAANAIAPSPLHLGMRSPTQSTPAVPQPTPALIRPDAKTRRGMWIGLVIGGLISLLAALAWG